MNNSILFQEGKKRRALPVCDSIYLSGFRRWDIATEDTKIICVLASKLHTLRKRNMWKAVVTSDNLSMIRLYALRDAIARGLLKPRYYGDGMVAIAENTKIITTEFMETRFQNSVLGLIEMMIPIMREMLDQHERMYRQLKEYSWYPFNTALQSLDMKSIMDEIVTEVVKRT